MPIKLDNDIENIAEFCPNFEFSIVNFIHNFRMDHLEKDAVSGLRRLLCDQIAVQIGVSQFPWSKNLLEYTISQQRSGVSRVVASPWKMSAADAAFVNASYGHGFEYDDAHGPSESHPGSCVIPAAFAIGEELNSKFSDVLEAIVVGYEVYTRIGLLASPQLLRRGFHPHAVLSNFGAAAVAAKLRRLDAETTLNALAIALSHASGTTEYTSSGGSIKRIHAGIGTRNGMVSADMAVAGITGPRAFMSGRKGFLQSFVQKSVNEIDKNIFDLGRRHEIASVWLKAYCACYCTHAYIDALKPFSARVADISRIDVRLNPAFNVVVGTANANAYEPTTIEHVQFSLPTQIAFALLGFGNGYKIHRDYLEGKVDMNSVYEIAKRVDIKESAEIAEMYPRKFVADVSVHFQSGQSESVFVEDPIGTTLNPMSEKEQDEKFRELTLEIIGPENTVSLHNILKDIPLDINIKEIAALCVRC